MGPLISRGAMCVSRGARVTYCKVTVYWYVYGLLLHIVGNRVLNHYILYLSIYSYTIYCGLLYLVPLPSPWPEMSWYCILWLRVCLPTISWVLYLIPLTCSAVLLWQPVSRPRDAVSLVVYSIKVKVYHLIPSRFISPIPLDVVPVTLLIPLHIVVSPAYFDLCTIYTKTDQKYRGFLCKILRKIFVKMLVIPNVCVIIMVQ